MAKMAPCRSCEREYHTTAGTCPHCGAKQIPSGYKSKIEAGLLAVFVGGLGLHRFYLGQWWGVFYLLLVWTSFPSIVAFFEGVVFLLESPKNWDDKRNGGFDEWGEIAKQRSNRTGVALVAAGFGTIVIIAILAAGSISSYEDYSIKAKVLEGVFLANSHREAVDSACATNQLHSDMSTAELGAGTPGQFEGRYVESVTVRVTSDDRADIIVVFNAISDAVQHGARVMYSGACRDGAMEWKIASDVPSRFLPR